MDLYFPNKSYLNKKVLIISLLFGFVVNLIFLAFFEFYTTSVAPVKKREIKVRYIPVKKTVKKKSLAHRKVQKKKVLKGNRKKVPPPTGKKISKSPVVPALTPVLPEVESLPEKDLTLPEKEVDLGEFSDIPVETGKIKEFRASSMGEFNPSFGTELSKIDRGAEGTAVGRKLIYRPSPPIVKTNIPPPPVKVKLWINKDGTVYKVQLLETTGNKKIDRLIKNYVQSWKFNEISENQKQWAVTTIRFKASK
ncbi:TonB family protein [Persephonella atlantica]|uniref:TonB family protein n=1 Tax=Persephonella atlantica TaxID=2699429 RepID=A0ABS1GG43_9AQUI|nr:TonB family protein [Persephonella atlantica]MBK3331885.1 TonB family protein [Persephonella atlantica]